MSLHMPDLETERLLVRPFCMDDLAAVHQLLDIDLSTADMGTEGAQPLEERKRWLEWSILNYEQLAMLYQPPYGDRAIVLKQTGRLIGACGFVPTLLPFEQLPSFQRTEAQRSPTLNTAEVGLFYAVSPAHQRKGYAAEAARAMIDYGFEQLRLKRIIATTNYDNTASKGVMKKLGMRIETNPLPEPSWLQVVGVLDHY